MFNSCVNFGVYVVFAPHFRHILVEDVFGLRRRSSRSRRRRGAEPGTGRCAGRATGCPGPCAGAGSARAVVGCTAAAAARKGDPSTVAASPCSSGWSAATVAASLAGDRLRGWSAAYRSEMAECFAISTPAQSPAEDRRQTDRRRPQDGDDVVLNGVAGGNSLPLQPLLSFRE